MRRRRPTPKSSTRVGLVLAPGLIDAGVFKAEPRACHAGGITRVVLMPDQSPPLDEPALVAFTQAMGKPDVWVHPLVAATRGLAGTELAEIGLGKAAGAVGVATGRSSISSTRSCIGCWPIRGPLPCRW